jgi:hypothetical protein
LVAIFTSSLHFYRWCDTCPVFWGFFALMGAIEGGFPVLGRRFGVPGPKMGRKSREKWRDFPKMGKFAVVAQSL